MTIKPVPVKWLRFLTINYSDGVCNQFPGWLYRKQISNGSDTVEIRHIETTIFDPVSEFLNHIDEVRNPACQRCVYKPSRNCHPSQRSRNWHLYTIKKLTPQSVIKKRPPQSLSGSQHLVPGLSGSRLWPYSGLNRPERCGSRSCPCTVSSPSFCNPASKKEEKNLWENLWNLKLVFPKPFQCPEREANMTSKSTHSPMQMMTTCPSMRGVTTMTRRKLVVLPQPIFMCDTGSR